MAPHENVLRTQACISALPWFSPTRPPVDQRFFTLVNTGRSLREPCKCFPAVVSTGRFRTPAESSTTEDSNVPPAVFIFGIVALSWLGPSSDSFQRDKGLNKIFVRFLRGPTPLSARLAGKPSMLV